jgi:hypothetical protein
MFSSSSKVTGIHLASVRLLSALDSSWPDDAASAPARDILEVDEEHQATPLHLGNSNFDDHLAAFVFNT